MREWRRQKGITGERRRKERMENDKERRMRRNKTGRVTGRYENRDREKRELG